MASVVSTAGCFSPGDLKPLNWVRAGKRRTGILCGPKTSPFGEAGHDRAGDGSFGRRAAILLGGSTLWTSMGGCRLCTEAAAARDWSYVGNCEFGGGWDGLCSTGKKQSPVNFTSTTRVRGGESLGMLDFDYTSSFPSIRNTGHGSIEVKCENARNVLRAAGHELQLLQFHFHAPSEHAFNGKHFAMEAHLVHRDSVSGKLAIVGIMFDANKDASPNECLAASLAYVPRENGQSINAEISVSPSLLLPPTEGQNGSRKYLHYIGSLTTPPCSEGVEWFVLAGVTDRNGNLSHDYMADTPLQISTSQALDFMRFSGDGLSLALNSRQVQPLGDRVVLEGP